MSGRHHIVIDTPTGWDQVEVRSVIHMNGGIDAVRISQPDRRVFWPWCRIWSVIQVVES